MQRLMQETRNLADIGCRLRCYLSLTSFDILRLTGEAERLEAFRGNLVPPRIDQDAQNCAHFRENHLVHKAAGLATAAMERLYPENQELFAHMLYAREVVSEVMKAPVVQRSPVYHCLPQTSSATDFAVAVVAAELVTATHDMLSSRDSQKVSSDSVAVERQNP